MSQWIFFALLFMQGATNKEELGNKEDSGNSSDSGIYAQTLDLIQTFGTAAAASPENDRALKAALAKLLAHDRVITASEVQELMNPEVFKKLAGADQMMTADEIAQSLKAAAPDSRRKLLPKIREHAEYLTTSFDLLSESQLQSSRKLADWLAKNYQAQPSLHVVVVCTGNSRRSMLGACMGNMAAAYYGMDKLHFHSGGTAPTAFNRRTIATLKAIGFDIAPTGDEAERGEPKTPNARYRVLWGEGLEAIEFSKRYSDKSIPPSGFAAVMVCTEADSECPTVPGAAFRLSMPFLDPKSYDDSKHETAKYAERRDDIGRTLMAVVAMASKKLPTVAKP